MLDGHEGEGNCTFPLVHRFAVPLSGLLISRGFFFWRMFHPSFITIGSPQILLLACVDMYTSDHDVPLARTSACCVCP